jgi:transcriptional regulator with XRE-family HTH domain
MKIKPTMSDSHNGIGSDEIDQILKEVGARIRARRKEVESNYEVFAKKYNINKVTLQRIESGANSSLKSLIQVADAIGIKLDDLFQDIH